MISQRTFKKLLRVAALGGALVTLQVPTLYSQSSDLAASDPTPTSDANDREEILVRIEARVSLPKSMYWNGFAWLQTLPIPPFAPLDRSAAYFNAVPSRYSQLSKLNYGSIFLNSIATGHLSPTNPGNARRLALATGMEFLGFRMARSERWRKMWWLPQTLSIGINLCDFRSALEVAQVSTSEAAQPATAPSRSHTH
jgi:hypothetical protein